MTFGEKLLELRRKGAMSQDVLAERLGVSRQAVSKWERDEAVPETDKIVRIAQIFGVTTDSLLLDEEPAPRQEPPRQNASFAQAPPPNPNTADVFGRAERYIRRHGYKFGYILIAIGTVLCLFSLGMRLLWPAIVGSIFEGFTNAGNSMFEDFGGLGGAGGIVMDENGNAIGSFEEIFGNGPVFGADGKPMDGWNDLFGSPGSVVESANQAMHNALQLQANLFLVLMLPGLLLIGAGVFVVIKGKQIAGETQV